MNPRGGVVADRRLRVPEAPAAIEIARLGRQHQRVIVLLPALMLLIGKRVWWLPRSLERVLPRLNV